MPVFLAMLRLYSHLLQGTILCKILNWNDRSLVSLVIKKGFLNNLFHKVPIHPCIIITKSCPLYHNWKIIIIFRHGPWTTKEESNSWAVYSLCGIIFSISIFERFMQFVVDVYKGVTEIHIYHSMVCFIITRPPEGMA